MKAHKHFKPYSKQDCEDIKNELKRLLGTEKLVRLE